MNTTSSTPSAMRLGLRENLAQFTLLVGVNALVGGMIGQERTVLPLLATDEFGPKFDIVYPSLSILAEPPVAVVDKVVDRKRTRVYAEGYLNYLYSPAGQDIIGRHKYRPRNPDALAKYARFFPRMNLVNIADFGGWRSAQASGMTRASNATPRFCSASV